MADQLTDASTVACFRAGARQIVDRLVATARRTAAGVTWPVTVSDPSGGPFAMKVEPARHSLYQGTSGIALFLAEYGRLTGEDDALALARQALAQAYDGALAGPEASFGAYSGRVGVAYVAWRLAQSTGDASLLDQARHLLAPLFGREREDHGLDVIAGAAGAIPPLLQLAFALDMPRLYDLLRQLGDEIVRRAHRGPVGWSWPGIPGAQSRNLAGLAHGAAGYGRALVELYGCFGEPNWLYAADQAFTYEATLFDEARRNWLDFRCATLGRELFGEGGRERVRRRLRQGETFSSEHPGSMIAWCHGAAGIALSRWRAFEVTGEPVYLQDARVATRTVYEDFEAMSLGRPLTHIPYAICHGVFGNCEALLIADRVDPPVRYAPQIVAFTRRAVEYHVASRVEWPAGMSGTRSDPSLMLGEAGVGLYLVRLIDPSIPSALLLPSGPTPSTSTSAAVVDSGRAPRASCTFLGADLDLYFGRTRRVAQALGAPAAGPLFSDEFAPRSHTIVDADRSIASLFESEPTRRAWLVDAAAPERARLALALSITNHTTEFVDTLRREPSGDVPWDSATFQLAPHVGIVECRWDWDAWLSSRAGDPPCERAAYYVVFRRANTARLKRISALTALVLRSLEVTGRASDVEEEARDALMAASVDTPPSGEVLALAGAVRDQLRSAYEAGIITATFDRDASS